MQQHDTPIIEVAGLCKHYPLYPTKRDRLIEALDPFRRKRHTTFAALQDVSFSIARGESVGIVGVNGAGKSTLLKILTGVLTPTSGTAKVHGRVAALLELGAGFHPERTGLENIYFQGAFQGFSRAEVEAYLPDVVDFADIGEFINQPVKLYSSGMFVRLAFAGAIQAQPDILIVDEALAVGDVRFQRKCFQRIEELKKIGTTFLFVSHATEQIVTHCTRALLLSQGSVLMDEEPRNVVNRYIDILFGREAPQLPEQDSDANKTVMPSGTSGAMAGLDPALREFLSNGNADDRFSAHPMYNSYEYRWGGGEAAIVDICMTSSGDPLRVIPGDRLALHMKVLFNTPVVRPIFGCTIKTRDGVTVYGSNSEINGETLPYEDVAQGTVGFVSFAFQCNLAPGEYFISLGVAIMDGDATPLDRRYDSLLLAVHGPANFFGIGDMLMEIRKTRETYE